MEKNTMGSFIAALRKANGLTQKELAERLNVSDKAVSRWERDESCPDLMLVPLIAETFNVTADELLKGQKNQTENNVKPVNEMSPKSIEKLVERQFVKFKNCSMISVGAIIFGFILLLLSVYLSVSKQSIPIWYLIIPCICYISVFILQSVFYNSFISSISTDEIDDKYLYAYRWKAKDRTWLIFSLVGFMGLFLGFTLLERTEFKPFAGFYYLVLGILFFIVLFLNRLFVVKNKKYLAETKDYEKSKKTINNAKKAIKLMLIFVASVVAMFSVLLILSHSSAQIFTEGTTFNNQQDFIEFMNTYNCELQKVNFDSFIDDENTFYFDLTNRDEREKRLDYKYYPEYTYEQNGQRSWYFPDILDFRYGVLSKPSYTWEPVTVYKDGKALFEYRTNRFVIDVKFSHSDTRMPVTVYTVEDYLLSRDYIYSYITIFIFFCAIEAVALIIVYRKKKEN